MNWIAVEATVPEEMNLAALRFILLLFFIIRSVSSYAQITMPNQGGSKVVAGDVFGKFYGKGVGGTLSGWNQSNPFGVSNILSGPTRGFCPRPAQQNDRDDSDRDNERLPASSGDDYSSGEGDEFDPNKNYAQGMEGLFSRLKDNASNICSKSDYSMAACAEDHHGNRTSKAKNDSIGRCWKYVKIGLNEAGLVNGYLGTESAIDAHKQGVLKENGFCQINISKSSDAPVGSILIYEWTQKRANQKGTSAPKHGHIEVKTGENEYISDFVSSEPIDQKDSDQRRFAAAYVPGPCSGDE